MILVLRIIIGLVLTAASIAKLLNMPGFVSVVHSYGIFPEGLHWPVAIAITVSELLIGFWLIWGRQLRKAAFSSLALHIIYAGFAGIMLLRGTSIINCGCFGPYLVRPLSWTTVGENLVLAALSFLLARLAHTTISPVRK
jgi:uncharacterized membrane protein YphA (DoxX/SURF4 family)